MKVEGTNNDPSPPANVLTDAATAASGQGLYDSAVETAQPARLPDLTPVQPVTASQLLAAMQAIEPAAGPAGGGSSESEKAAQEELAQLQKELGRTFEPWEACPDVTDISLSWQNVASDAAFHREPALLPYTVDVFCGGYQFTGAARGAQGDYGGLSYVLRDFWTDLRQSESTQADRRAAQPLRAAAAVMG